MHQADTDSPLARSRTWRSRSVLGIGEAMLEFAPTGGETYQRGFAGDTFNTCWHLAQLLGDAARVGYLTRFGRDAFSDQLLAFLEASRIDTRHIERDAERTLGLYVISLIGAERQFSYWRDLSAARRLADDPALLERALADCGLVHVSGITLAVIGAAGRRNLLAALREARRDGTVVSFDPNLRRRLWPDERELREAMTAMLAETDIALPSFDDEAALWGDADPGATLARLEQQTVGEIVLKDGEREVAMSVGAVRIALSTPTVPTVRDTTGAGDAFNAGYLAGRLLGFDAVAACRLGQRLAGIVIGHPGALAPRDAIDGLRDEATHRSAVT